MGAFSLLHYMLFVLFGFGLPVGMPPLPEDPVVTNVAPEDCWAYLSSAGMATPNAKSENQTEQLLAEQEVQRMATEIEKAIRTSVQQIASRGNLPPGVTSSDIVDAAKLLLTRPLAVYVSSIPNVPGDGELRGGIIVNCGDKVEKIKKLLDATAKTVPPQLLETVTIGGQSYRSIKLPFFPELKQRPVVVFGFKDKYLLLGVGRGEVEAMLKRMDGKPAAWLTKLNKELPVERLSMVTYVNIKAVSKFASTLPDIDARIATITKALGLDSATTFASVSGLDKKGCVSKSLLGLDGELQGLLRLADIKPLTPADLAVVPSDATFALAFKFNPTDAFDAALAGVNRVEPRAKTAFLLAISQLEEQLGLKLRDELLASLGDTWRVFDSPSEGGMFTGATLAVSLNNAKKAAAANQTLVETIKTMLPKNGGRSLNPFGQSVVPELAGFEFSGNRIHIFQGGFGTAPVTVSWCVTDKELIMALYPQSIKAYLSRGKDFQSLAQSPAIASLFHGDAGPIKLAYGDTQRFFDLVYPVLPVYTTAITRFSRISGLDLNVSMLPSAHAVRPHLAPTTISVERTKAGIEITERRSLPSVSMAAAMPIAIGMALPAVSASREAARRIQSTNNMKQISLAIHNYAQAHKVFPPAYTVDKNGKPLLSWRVLLLPYLEGDGISKEFHMDEPWDSPHNKKLLAKMPKVYQSPASKVAGQWKTNYLTVRGKDTMFHGKEPITFASTRDGLSNTIMTVEVSDARAVEWTRPDDFEYDPKNPMMGLPGLWQGGFNVGLGDGSVRFISSSIRPDTLKALFTRAGGEVVDFDF